MLLPHGRHLFVEKNKKEFTKVGVWTISRELLEYVGTELLELTAQCSITPDNGPQR